MLVATTTVERFFLDMKIVKTSLSNRMGDRHMSHRLIYYIEKEEMKKVSNEVMQMQCIYFQRIILYVFAK